MTVQNEQVNIETVATQTPMPPQIQSEVDIPFNNVPSCQGLPSDRLAKTDSLDEEITKFKYVTGKNVLFISMGAMGLSVLVSIALSCFKIENTLVENAFEVFKLIAMTVLGYIFGSKTK